MVKTMLKSASREIRQSLGRYLAILAIVGLGVGFFAGLRTSQPAMMATGVEYLEEQNLFDFRMLSTLGFTDEDVERFAAQEGVAAARGRCLLTSSLSGQRARRAWSGPTRSPGISTSPASPPDGCRRPRTSVWRTPGTSPRTSWSGC